MREGASAFAMHFLALATDYDGTIAQHGQVSEATLGALKRLRESGRKLIVVTGRELRELRADFDHLELFDLVVVENGAVLYQPSHDTEKTLSDPMDARLADRLRERGVRMLSVGRVIVATHEPYENVALEAIRDLGLECQVIFNKGAVMILPSGVNKASGLAVALEQLGLSRHNVVGVGDAENDHAFLDICGCAVAVANSVPALRDRADLVTEGDHGFGVVELIDRMIRDDLADVSFRPGHRGVPLAAAPEEVRDALFLGPRPENILVAGASGGGKSTLLTGIIERLVAQEYQALIIDPEGDHAETRKALVLGSPKQAPTIDEIVGALERPHRTVVANIFSVRLEDQPAFLSHLLPALEDLRKDHGRPHWLVLDEVHHLLPEDDENAKLDVAWMPAVIAATVDPRHVSTSWLQGVDRLIVTGSDADKTVQAFCAAVGEAPPESLPSDLEKGEALHWRRGDSKVQRFESIPAQTERRRHVRKYAEGDLGEERSFMFRGPHGKLKLRAKNLERFLELADGVDDETWEFHRRAGDYSRWVREKIKDDDLADAIARFEQTDSDDPAASRAAIRQEIEHRYTAAS